ncbi:DUF4815 domain-containing protein [Shinella sp. NM-101]|uniref:DUF4815 domain-containing protein n=1 Tax=Shinella sp. NM-101 TaxID=2744455 RepID=UPI001F41105F|nr:DUF4815 domain-containing protein [Shinella sp. NM-101]
MAFEHPSGLPNAFNRALQASSALQGLVFYGERPYFQGAELNDLQTIHRANIRRVGRMIVSDGTRIERGDAFVDKETETVTLEAGRVYADGDVWDVDAAILSDVPMTGRIEIGIRIVTTYVTHEDDPTLLGLVPGSDAEGEPGAAREYRAAAWAYQGDGGVGMFVAVYTLQDGTILDQVGPDILAPALQAVVEYDRPNGNYIVSGCQVTALGAQGGAQHFSIAEGEANINGYKRTRFAALRHAEAEEWDELAIPGETHTYPGGASHTFTVAAGPIGVINSILLTKEKTVTVTRGAVVNGADGLPDTSVIQLVEVKQAGTTYVAGTDYNRVNNTVDWSPAGAEPAGGSTYTVTYRYRASVTADASTLTTITVSGGATGGDIIVAYTRRLPRIDRICLAQDGSPIYLRGLSATSNPRPPAVPMTALKLATITNDWTGTPSVENDGTNSLSWDELWPYLRRIVDHDRLIQLERLKSGIDSREPVAKKGMFVDPFIDDTYRDEGTPQSGAIVDGILMLSIEPTFFAADLAEPVMLDWIEEVISEQPLKTGCEKINPYANFTPIPGVLKLTPAVDFWTVSRTEWMSDATREFNRGVRIDGGPLQQTSSTTERISSRTEALPFLRQIAVSFTISGFGAGEILESLVFDGSDVTPAGPLVANGSGVVSGNFTIPVGVTAGTKIVEAAGAGGTGAAAMFVGQGTVAIDVMRRVTTVETWTARIINSGGGGGRGGGMRGDSSRDSDPQAQLFAVDRLRQVVGVDFHICNIGSGSHDIIVDQVTTDNGFPTNSIVAEARVPMVGAAVGWKSPRFLLPATTSPERKHAFVIKTDDNEHSVSLAKLGAFDAALQRWVTAHPYVIGPRFSSVNAETWTAHQDEALAFRIVAARYPVTTKTVTLGSFDLVDCSDLQVRAIVELPSPGCSVEFEIERTNGTIYRLAPYQVLQLTEYITETVELRAVLRGTSELSPVLYAPVELVAGEIAEELTYVTRAFALGAAVRVATYLKAFLPGGSTVAVDIKIDGGSWDALPLDDTEALAFPNWTERKYQDTGLTGSIAQIRITATGGPSARVLIGDLGAGIF